MRWSAFTGFTLFVLLHLTPQFPLVAQIEVQARLGADIGMVTPGGRLYKWENRFAGGWDVTRSQTELGSFPVIGISLDVGDPDLGFWLKARLHRSIGLQADFNGYGFNACEGYCLDPVAGSVHLQWDLDSEITEFGLDLALPTRIGFGGVEPFVFAGWGIRHYSFKLPDRSEWRGFNLPGGGSESSVRFGCGLEFEVLGRPYSLSVMDTMADYWGDRTHHVFWELGIPLANRILFSR